VVLLPAAPSAPRIEDARSDGSSSAKAPLAITGGALMGLGGLTMIAAGITYLVAWGDSRALDDECPNQVCIEGTRGGDSLERAKDASDAADILAGIGAPVFGTGLVLLLYSAALGGEKTSRLRASPSVTPGGARTRLEVTF
jgi:hypothetical protein